METSKKCRYSTCRTREFPDSPGVRVAAGINVAAELGV